LESAFGGVYVGSLFKSNNAKESMIANDPGKTPVTPLRIMSNPLEKSDFIIILIDRPVRKSNVTLFQKGIEP
jgi:hypothetical protein